MRPPAYAVVALGLLAVCPPVLAQSTEPFDHVHLAVPDVERARDWYIQHMGGNAGETPETVAWGKWPGDHPLPVQLLFTLSPDAKPSAGSVLDHIGFSFANLAATVEELRTAGVTIVSPVTDVPGLGRQAIAEDPWGTKLELLEDPDAPGIHHVELRVPDPDAALRFYVRAFGGDRTKYKGVVDAIRYRDLGVFYLFAVRDDNAAPAAGRTIDHIGFGPIELERVVSALKAEGTTFTSNPNPRINPACRFLTADAETGDRGVRRLYCAQPDQLAHRTVYLDAPGGVHVELLQHLEAGGH
ncbi:MAG: VOC family protein [Acidobacteria bacterium]|nr:VOC family protein [Acidobacteriota bacterium]